MRAARSSEAAQQLYFGSKFDYYQHCAAPHCPSGEAVRASPVDFLPHESLEKVEASRELASREAVRPVLSALRIYAGVRDARASRTRAGAALVRH